MEEELFPGPGGIEASPSYDWYIKCVYMMIMIMMNNMIVMRLMANE